MAKGFNVSKNTNSWAEEDKDKLIALISAQKAQGDMNALQPTPVKENLFDAISASARSALYESA